MCLKLRRRGCIRSSCCPQSSCVGRLTSCAVRCRMSITSDVRVRSRAREVLRAPPTCIHLSLPSLSDFSCTVFPSFHLPARPRPIEKILFFQVSRTMWRLALLEWKLHSSLLPPSCPLAMPPMYFNHSFFETRPRKNTKLESRDGGCPHPRLCCQKQTLVKYCKSSREKDSQTDLHRNSVLML